MVSHMHDVFADIKNFTQFLLLRKAQTTSPWAINSVKWTVLPHTNPVKIAKLPWFDVFVSLKNAYSVFLLLFVTINEEIMTKVPWSIWACSVFAAWPVEEEPPKPAIRQLSSWAFGGLGFVKISVLHSTSLGFVKFTHFTQICTQCVEA